jgi:hypothetical protein
MEKTGLAWDVQRVTSEAMERKRVAQRVEVAHPLESPGKLEREVGTIDVA